MGQLTRDQIVSEGQLLAGRDDNATASNAWLQRWLDSVAASWAWPTLHDEAINIAVTAGTGSVTVGGGSGGITPRILKVLDNLWLYDSTRTFRRRLRLKHFIGDPVDRIGATDNVGTPTSVRVKQTTFGTWVVYLDVIPDKAYLMTVPFIFLPPAIVSGSEVPWYPNDESMVQAVHFKNREFYDGPEHPSTQAAQQALASLVSNDRSRYGMTPGINDNLILDPSVFRTRK